MKKERRKFYRKDSKDITGNVYGKLTAMKPIQIKGERGLRWLCSCTCGKEKIVHGGHLRAGSTKSCGCLVLDRLDESSKSALYGRYLAKSKKRNIDFFLNRQQFDNLIFEKCFYCKRDPFQSLKNSTNREVGFYNGIDRYDSNKPYTLENCVSCCKICNMMKSNLPYIEFIEHIKRILKYAK